MVQKKTLYACVILMIVFFLGFNRVHGRTLANMKVDDNKTTIMAKQNDLIGHEKVVQLSPPPPPPSPPPSGGKGAEEFRPTTPGHSPSIGHSLSHD